MAMLNNAALMSPARLVWPGSWVGHIPFASWVVGALRPRILVELGTHTGNSYNGLCQAALEQAVDTRAFAVDTWEGDKHAGAYDDSIFLKLKAYHEPLYGQFSTMLRMTFDEALNRFEDGTVDLLHIDGLHTYEAVRHDFESWLPKLSGRGVVLFHDTEVYREDFGVHRLWSELSLQYPSFNFKHSNGLGVLLVGSEVPREIAALAERAEPGHEWRFACKLFRTLGERLERQSQMNELQLQIDGRDTELASAREVVAHLDGDIRELRTEISRRDDRIEELDAFQQRMAADRLAETTDLRVAISQAGAHIESRELAFQNVETALREQAAALRQRELQLTAQLDELGRTNQQLLSEGAGLRAQLEAIMASTSWRVTAPLRALGAMIKRDRPR